MFYTVHSITRGIGWVILNCIFDRFSAGKEHTISIECDLWPDIIYGKQKSGANDGYKKLKLEVVRPNIDMEKYESVKANILERYKELEDTKVGTPAQTGDVVIVNMLVCTTFPSLNTILSSL